MKTLIIDRKWLWYQTKPNMVMVSNGYGYGMEMVMVLLMEFPLETDIDIFLCKITGNNCSLVLAWLASD